MPNRTEAALRKQRLRMPPGDYRYCACSRLYSKIPEVAIVGENEGYAYREGIKVPL